MRAFNDSQIAFVCATFVLALTVFMAHCDFLWPCLPIPYKKLSILIVISSSDSKIFIERIKRIMRRLKILIYVSCIIFFNKEFVEKVTIYIHFVLIILKIINFNFN